MRSDLRTCVRCVASMRQTLINHADFTEALRRLNRDFPLMTIRFNPRTGQRLLCGDCKAAEHSKWEEVWRFLRKFSNAVDRAAHGVQLGGMK